MLGARSLPRSAYPLLDLTRTWFFDSLYQKISGVTMPSATKKTEARRDARNAKQLKNRQTKLRRAQSKAVKATKSSSK